MAPKRPPVVSAAVVSKAPPSMDVNDMFDSMNTEPDHHVSRPPGPSDAGKPLSHKQTLLLSSQGAGFVTVEDLLRNWTNSEFNKVLVEGRQYYQQFMSTHKGKPASALLYFLTEKVALTSLPPKDTATHVQVMDAWVKAQEKGLKFDNAVALIFDFGVDAEKVLAVSDERATAILKGMMEARAAGQIPNRSSKRPRLEDAHE